MKEKSNQKKLMIGGGILILLIALAIGIVILNKQVKKQPLQEEKTTNETEIKHNTNQQVVEDKEINNITFTNIECSYDGENSLLTYTITNKTTETINLGEYDITIKDKEGNILAILAPTLDQNIAPGESYETGNAINIDLTTAYSIELNLNQ